MNPLDLPGPQFLALYAVLGLVVLVWLHVGRRRDEDGVAPKVDLSDPYLIAYLRGGATEAARVACVSLVDRGLLVVDDDEGTVHARHRVQGLRVPLEQELVDIFRTARSPVELFVESLLGGACESYHRTLTRLGLLPDEDAARARRRRLLLVLAILVGLALAKVAVGLSRDRPVGFLVLLAIAFSGAAVWLHNPWQTARGLDFLASLRRLFARLRERAGTLRPRVSASETALLLAVFGLGALPRERFAWAHRLFPKASQSGSNGACGTACGSGCGGGGCGGGCGGCGGGGE